MGGQGPVYYYVTSSLLLTTCSKTLSCSGQLCSSFESEISSYSSLGDYFSFSTVLGHVCVISFCFIMHQMITVGDGSALQAGQLRLEVFHHTDMLLLYVENVIWHCLAEISKPVAEKGGIIWQ